MPLAGTYLRRRPLARFLAEISSLLRSKEGVLSRRLLLVFGVYTFARVVFLIDHFELFRGEGAAALFDAFLQGARFDLSAIAYSNVPFIFLSLAPAALLARRNYQRALLTLFVLVNGAMTIIMFGDIAYFPFTGTRVTLDIFAFSGEAATQAPQLLKNYAGLASLTVVLVVALGVFFPRALPRAAACRRSPSSRSTPSRKANTRSGGTPPSSAGAALAPELRARLRARHRAGGAPSGSVSTLRIVAIPRTKSPTRRFSFGECWLLSGFTVPRLTAGTPSVVTKGEIGIDPPEVRSITGSWPKRRTIARRSQRPGSESNSVRNARYEVPLSYRAIRG